MQYLKDHQYQVIGLDTLLAQLQQGKEPADNAVVITFDDGFDNIYLQAHPILQEFGFPYTVFLSPALIDRKEGPVMSWQQIKQLQKDGVIIANHSSYHDHLAAPNKGESKAQWLKRVKTDILLAQGKAEQAMTMLEQQYLLRPNNLVVTLNYANVALKSGANRLAIHLLKNLLYYKNDSILAYDLLSEAYKANGDMSRYYEAKADLSYQLANYPKAIDDLNEALNYLKPEEKLESRRLEAKKSLLQTEFDRLRRM